MVKQILHKIPTLNHVDLAQIQQHVCQDRLVANEDYDYSENHLTDVILFVYLRLPKHILK